MVILANRHVSLIVLFGIYFVPARNAPESQEEIDWNERGQEELEAALNNWPKWKPAKNIILFIGDGLGISTLTAARFFQAQHTESEGREEDAQLSWDSFPATGLIKVRI